MTLLVSGESCSLIPQGAPVTTLSEQERVVLGADIDLSDTTGRDLRNEDYAALAQSGRVTVNRMVFRDTRLADARGREWTESTLISSEPFGPSDSKETFDAVRQADGIHPGSVSLNP